MTDQTPGCGSTTDARKRAAESVPLVHAVMYRDYQIGTLCNSGAWGPARLFTAVTDEVTCPGCRTKIDGVPKIAPPDMGTWITALRHAQNRVLEIDRMGKTPYRDLSAEDTQRFHASAISHPDGFLTRSQFARFLEDLIEEAGDR